MLTLDELRADQSIDTVIMAFTDMQGRLLGKRLHRDFFFEQVEHGHGTEGCNYLLALDMEMDPVPGYEIASWERGYGDFNLAPDLSTLRRIPWLEATALVLCDVEWGDGSPVRPSPRQVLRAQVERARALGFEVMVGSELEFYLLRETYEEAHAKGYRDLTPSVPYILDYHILATTLRRAAAAPDPQRDARRRHPRRDVEGRGVARSAGDQLPLRRRADDGRQPRRLQERRQGDRAPERLLDHVHGEARPHVDRLVVSHPLVALARRRERVRGRDARRSASTSPGRSRARASWRCSSRRTSTRTSGSPPARGRRRRSRGASTTARAASGSSARVRRCESSRASPAATSTRTSRSPRRSRRVCYGIENNLELPPALEGNAYESDAERFPSTLREAIAALESGSMARAALGDDVVDHYLNYARTEQGLFDKVVTSWERERSVRAWVSRSSASRRT